MKIALRFGSVSLVIISACSSGGGEAVCAKLQDCAVKGGDKFSETECKKDLQTTREESNTAGCGDEFSAHEDCVGGIDFSCSDDLGKKIDSECGSTAKALSKCFDGKPGGGKTPGGGSNECEDNVQRYSDKFYSCIEDNGNSSSSSSETTVECTSALKANTKKIADCYEAASCDAIDGSDTKKASELAKCLQ